MNTYSSYADTPIDRDRERLAADLRALPTASNGGTRRTGRTAWLRRHLHLRTRHA